MGSQVPNLGDYDPNQIIEIKGDLQSNNDHGKPTEKQDASSKRNGLIIGYEPFKLTAETSKILSKYNKEQLFQAGPKKEQSRNLIGDNDKEQQKFVAGQKFLASMGHTKIFRIENDLLDCKATKENMKVSKKFS